MKKILLVTPSFNIGGIERNMEQLSTAFLNKGINVDIVVLHDGKKYVNYDNRANIITPNRKRGNTFYLKLFYRLFLPFYIRKSVKYSKPDIVLSMADTFNGIVILSCLGLKTKVFIGDITKPDLNFAFTTKLMKKLFYPYSVGFIAQTKSAANYYIIKFKNKLNIRVIGPIVNKIEISENSKRENIILNVGRLSPEKGQDRMVEIFSRLQNNQDWRLVFTADGPLKPQIINLIQKHHLENKVELLGYVPNLNDLYSKASIFVLTSRFEGYPNALVEAMAAKLPCIVFNSFPVEEIITDQKDGFIIPDGDNLEFINCLEMLINDENLRHQIGNEARLKVENFTSETISGQFIDFFNNL